MGFDFLLVQPQVFIEKKKPHLSRYTCITPAETYLLYWGRSGYQFCVDYAKLDTDLKEHEADIFAQYQVLQEMIAQSFE